MLEERDIKKDTIALALLVLVVFLALALLTHSPADPLVELVYPFDQIYQQDVLSYPQRDITQNACGRWGAWTSSVLFDLFGLGAWFLVGSLGAVCGMLLTHREIDSPILRLVGWTLAFFGLTTLVSMLIPSWTEATVFGAGGSLGALGRTILRYYFANIGGCILALSLLFGGLLLCTDYVLVHLGLMLGALTIAGVTGRRWSSVDFSGADGALDESDELEFEDEEDSEVAVRVGGRTIRLLDEEDLEDEEGGEAEDEWYDDEEDEHEYNDEEDQADEDGAEEDEPESGKKRSLVAKVAGAASSLVPGTAGATSPPSIKRGRDGKRRLSPFRVHPPEPEDRETVMTQLDEASLREASGEYKLPSVGILQKPEEFAFDEQIREVRRNAKVLEKTFKSFGYEIKVVDVSTGPVIAQYEIELESGLRLSKITSLSDDIAIALRVPSVRIVAPIPGKNSVGVEVPNEKRQLVRLREVMNNSREETRKMNIPVFLGKDVSGNPLVVDLAKLPHLLIAGRTGTGKSVCLNAIIASMLMTRRPDEVRMLMIDPKMVELSGYKSLPHLMHPVVTDMRKAEAILAWAVDKMEERYQLLARAGVRHLTSYNQLSKDELMERLDPVNEDERRAIPLHMPFIVIVADEMADLMMTAGKEVQQHIIRLAQKSRAVGIHLILATQKPTVDVITGLIKSNLPARIAFQVASRTDSRVVLDEMGADKLLGNGDMLFLSPGTSQLVRGQGTYLGDDEINAVVAEASQGEQNFVKELVHLKVEDADGKSGSGKIENRDELYEQAIEVIIEKGRGSCSLLQRALGIGYGRAARLIDFMAEDGIVGPYAGSQAREVVMTMEEFRAMTNGEAEAPQPEGQSAKSPAAAAATQQGPMPGDDDVDADDDDGEDDCLEPSIAMVQSLERPTVTIVPAPEDAELDEDDEEYEYEYEYVEVDEDAEGDDDDYEYEEYEAYDEDAEVEETV